MLLTIDVGNTNTGLGVFRGDELIATWRLTTARAQTVDEYGVLTRNLFSLAGLNQEMITGVIVCSVSGSGPRCAISWSSVAFPSIFLAGSRSRSTTHMRVAGPVGAPIMALGHFCHHVRI